MLIFLFAGACRRPANLAPEYIYKGSLSKLQRGDLVGALMGVEGALRKYSDPKEDWHWRFTTLKAEILMREGLYRESLALLEPDLPAALASSDSAVWRKLTQGAALSYLSQFSQSAQVLAEAEWLAKTHHPDLLGEVALRKGTLTDLRGDSKTAALLYSTALGIARAQKDYYLEAAALGSLGFIATEQEHYDESIDWDEKALRVSQSFGALGSVEKILVNMGWSYFEMGDYERALSLFQQAEESAGKAGLVIDQIICRLNIGEVNYYLHDYATAEQRSQEALALARRLDKKPEITEGLNNLSRVALARGQNDLAEKYNAEALNVSHGATDRIGELNSALIQGRIESVRRQYQKTKHLLERVIQNPAAQTALRWEAQARLAKVYDDEGRFGPAGKEYRKAIGTIEAARTSVSSDELRLTFLTSAIEFYDDYVDFLMTHGKADDALKIAELSRARTLAEGLASTKEDASLSSPGARPQQIAQTLKASILFYWIGHNHSYLWVITPAKTAYFTLPKAADIEPLVKSYRQAILGIRDAQDVGSADGQRLYAMLVEPARKLIPSGSRVIVLPAESLYGLNFETLIVPTPHPHFWIEDVTLTTASSLTLLASSHTRSLPKGKTLFLVGNTEPNPDFPVLSQAPAEMQKIARYFPDASRKVLEGKQATPAAYLTSNPERFSYLHFVTHGTASRTRPLESTVILSKDGDSYKLYARDIIQHRLNASLVTISACNGAGTRAYSGEGLVGLSWAFLRAGAHNVIGALWEVSDASTPQLMDTLYGELSQGTDPATALRDAKLKLLHSADAASVFKKPFYWAPFQLYAGS